MTDAPPPYPGINGNNGYRLETRLVTRLGNRLKFARLEKKKEITSNTNYVYRAIIVSRD